MRSNASLSERERLMRESTTRTVNMSLYAMSSPCLFHFPFQQRKVPLKAYICAYEGHVSAQCTLVTLPHATSPRLSPHRPAQS